MKPRWLLGLAVVLVVVWCGGAVAGPGGPSGDPDIWERSGVYTGTKVGTSPPAREPMTIDVWFIQWVPRQPAKEDRPCAEARKLPATSKDIDWRR